MGSPAARAGHDQARSTYEIGRMVRELREARGLTQRELAERMGTTQSALGLLEAGASPPAIATLGRVAGALGLRLEVRFHDPLIAASVSTPRPLLEGRR